METETEVSFHKTIEIARQQETKMLELRVGDELEPAMAKTGQEGKGTADAGGDLQLVHRRVWYGGFAKGWSMAGGLK